jgi:hypothetical protein
MRPMLDDLELPQVQAITTSDRRSLVEHKPPAMEGSLLQNLGRRATRLTVAGVVTGPDANAVAASLDAKFKQRTPVPFAADVAADLEIAQVLIDDLRLEQLAGKPERIGYMLLLREFIEPVAPADAALLDADILADAQGLIDDIVDGLSLAQAFATGLEQFVPTFADLLSRLQQANQPPS